MKKEKDQIVEETKEQEPIKNKRLEILMAKKKRLQRQTRQKLPKALRWEKSSHIKRGTRFVRSAHTLASSGRLVNYVGVLCPSKLKLDG